MTGTFPSNKSTIVIETFSTEYQVEVKNLITAGLAEHWGEADPTLNPDLNDISQSYDISKFFIALSDGKVIGTSALVHRSEEIAEVVRMSVDKSWRRAGVGSMILKHLVDKAICSGYKELVLEATSEWKDVISFYNSFGFQFTHESVGEFGRETHLSMKIG